MDTCDSVVEGCVVLEEDAELRVEAGVWPEGLVLYVLQPAFLRGAQGPEWVGDGCCLSRAGALRLKQLLDEYLKD